MVVLLVVAVFVSAAAIALLRQRRAQALALATAIDTPIQDVRFHVGHAWAAPVGSGYYKVGVNDLAASLAGTPTRINLPARGSRLYQTVHQIQVANGGRRLDVPSPLTGKVALVNRDAIDNPGLIAQDPYRRGWLAVIRPHRLQELSTLLDGDAGRRWLDNLRRRVAEFTHQASPVTAWDGGPLRPGFGDDLTDVQFEELRAELFGTGT